MTPTDLLLYHPVVTYNIMDVEGTHQMECIPS